MISALTLNNFRIFENRNFKFGKNITLLLGANGSGKTSILEGVYLLSHAKSFRAKSDFELIAFNNNFSKIEGETSKSKLAIYLLSQNQSLDLSRNVKKYEVDGFPKKRHDFLGNLYSVTFLPLYMDLMSGSPSLRRDFLNDLLIQTSKEYRASLLSYEKGLRSRNRVLKSIREGRAKESHLFFWDELLIRNGNIITNTRMEFIEYMNSVSKLDGTIYKVFYERSEISKKRLEDHRQAEIASSVTLVGPHRDDIVFFENRKGVEVNLMVYGSRGEQRMALLWAKLCEIQYIEKKLSTAPVLLLDDIYSELDEKNRLIVQNIVSNRQTIITSSEEIPLGQKKEVDIIHL